MKQVKKYDMISSDSVEEQDIEKEVDGNEKMGKTKNRSAEV